jgi:DNA-binding CsgD family transcriptional regulator
MLCVPSLQLLVQLEDMQLQAAIRQGLHALHPPNPFDHTARQLAVAVLDRNVSESVELVESLDRTGTEHRTLQADALSAVADLCLKLGDKRAKSFAEAAFERYETVGASGDAARVTASHPSLKRGDEPLLSPAERRVVSLVIDGFSNADIAEQLFLSVKTVETHLARVYRKCGVKSRTQLISKLR